MSQIAQTSDDKDKRCKQEMEPLSHTDWSIMMPWLVVLKVVVMGIDTHECVECSARYLPPAHWQKTPDKFYT
jgi:nicotinamidase-related amidase